MNKTIKRKWLQELRSGNYKQGKSYLRRLHPKQLKPDELECRWCCLGILADVTHPEVWQKAQAAYYDHQGCGRFPSGDVTAKAELTIEACRHVARMNDSEKPFSEIADWIEENL